jgi:hypothetical protein
MNPYDNDPLHATINAKLADVPAAALLQKWACRAFGIELAQSLAWRGSFSNSLPWQKADPVGEGEEYRAQQGEEVHGSALTLHEMPVHLSVVVAG